MSPPSVAIQRKPSSSCTTCRMLVERRPCSAPMMRGLAKDQPAGSCAHSRSPIRQHSRRRAVRAKWRMGLFRSFGKVSRAGGSL